MRVCVRVFSSHPIHSGQQSTPFGIKWVNQPGTGSHRRKATQDFFFFSLHPPATFIHFPIGCIVYFEVLKYRAAGWKYDMISTNYRSKRNTQAIVLVCAQLARRPCAPRSELRVARAEDSIVGKWHGTRATLFLRSRPAKVRGKTRAGR